MVDSFFYEEKIKIVFANDKLLCKMQTMIKSFGNKETENLFNKIALKKVPADIQTKAFRKLHVLDDATSVERLFYPPSNRLERLHGKLKDFYSIRVNNRWRIIFRFERGDAFDVEFVDYH